MTKFFALILALMFSVGSYAKCIGNDSWTGKDKRQHAVIGAFIGSAGTIVFQSPHKGFLAGAAVGLAKEWYDARGGGTCSYQDFAVTALAAAGGAYGTAWLVLPKKDGVFVGYTTKF